MSVQVLILAAGSGTLLSPLLHSTPKALLPLANHPLLYHVLHPLLSLPYPISIAIPPNARTIFSTFLSTLPATPSTPSITLLDTPETHSTAHCLHLLPPFSTAIVLPCDYISPTLAECIQRAVAEHERFQSTATVVLHPRCKVVDAKTKAKSGKYVVDHYAMLSPAAHLLALVHPSDITAAQLPIPPTILAHHSTVSVRSDLYDPHIYVVSAAVLQLLHVYKGIASMRYDLIPFLARRQRRLSRLDIVGPVSVRAHVTEAEMERELRGVRVNSVERYLETSMVMLPSGKGKGKGKRGKGKPTLPFEKHGERCNVADSIVGDAVVAGDMVSVKKSVVGSNVSLATSVKISASVLHDGVVVGENVNLTGCILCAGARIGNGVVLKDCQVEAGFVVGDDVQEEVRFLGNVGLAGSDDDDGDIDGVEFC